MPNAINNPAATVLVESIDVLYINFYYPPKTATQSEVTDDDVVIRYENDEVIGLTILSVQTR
jgi:uncharacterized protein YuzE